MRRRTFPISSRIRMHCDSAVGTADLLGEGDGAAEAHRPVESPTPQYFLRHYYDLAMLLDTDEGKAAAIDFALLAQVAKHKSVFFRSGWASYDAAQPGTLQLMPTDAQINDL